MDRQHLTLAYSSSVFLIQHALLPKAIFYGDATDFFFFSTPYSHSLNAAITENLFHSLFHAHDTTTTNVSIISYL